MVRFKIGFLFLIFMDTEVSRDGTVKLNFDAGYSVVVIPLGGKKTICLSSQVGCPMGCSFCLSGKKKFERNLTLDELKGQLDAAWDYVGRNGECLADDISGIVFMGMGEPMANLDNVLAFCAYVNAEYGYAYSRILVSTSGIIPGMRRVIREYGNKIQLAVSLHSCFQDVRDNIMPGLKWFPIDELVKVMHEYNEVYRQKIMIEYLMIDGVTDRDEDLDALIGLGLVKRSLFNLIRLNGDVGGMRASDEESVEVFRKRLMESGYKCFTRASMGRDIGAACGMLR